jgi:hypothetical protein
MTGTCCLSLNHRALESMHRPDRLRADAPPRDGLSSGNSAIRINTLNRATAGHRLLARPLRKRFLNPSGSDREAFDEAS